MSEDRTAYGDTHHSVKVEAIGGGAKTPWRVCLYCSFAEKGHEVATFRLAGDANEYAIYLANKKGILAELVPLVNIP